MLYKVYISKEHYDLEFIGNVYDANVEKSFQVFKVDFTRDLVNWLNENRTEFHKLPYINNATSSYAEPVTRDSMRRTPDGSIDKSVPYLIFEDQEAASYFGLTYG